MHRKLFKVKNVYESNLYGITVQSISTIVYNFVLGWKKNEVGYRCIHK